MTEDIIAKPIVDKKFWILRQDDRKIGNIEATDHGYQVIINNHVEEFKNIKSLVDQYANIKFEKFPKPSKTRVVSREVYGFQTKYKIHNPMFDVKHQVPVYTDDEESKSWMAAGWYQLKKGRHWEVVQDPKLILIQRYPYRGPYHTKEEAEKSNI